MPIADYARLLRSIQQLADQGHALWGVAPFDCVRDSPPRMVDPQTVTVAQSLVFYLQAKAKHDVTMRSTIPSARQIIRHMGGLPLSHLNEYALEQYGRSRQREAKERGVSLESSTIMLNLEIVRAAAYFCEHGGEDRVKIVTWVPRFRLPHIPKSPKTILELEDLTVLKAVLTNTPHALLFLMIAVYTGLRHRAILDLTWDRVVFAERIIISNPFGRKQTHKFRPIVPICDPLFEILAVAYTRRVNEYVISFQRRRLKTVRGALSAAFARAAEAQLNALWFETQEDRRERLRASAERLQHATIHTFRYMLLTLLNRAGVSRTEQMKQLGHSQPPTSEYYCHASAETMVPLIAELEAANQESEEFYSAAAEGDEILSAAARGGESANPGHAMRSGAMKGSRVPREPRRIGAARARGRSSRRPGSRHLLIRG